VQRVAPRLGEGFFEKIHWEVEVRRRVVEE